MNRITPFSPAIILRANQIARSAGHGRATRIIEGNRDCVLSHVAFGYRKISDDQYVPNSYRSNFGWKNTYYQKAATVVMVAS